MEDKNLYVFGDETGDLGFAFERGSSRYFAIALILTNDPDSISLEIQHLRQRLRLSRSAEFRFHDMSNNFRTQFLKTVRPLPFNAYVLVVDKTELNKRWQKLDNPSLYALFLTELIKHMPSQYFGKIILSLDQFGSIKLTKAAIRREIKRLGIRPLKRINMKRSQGNDLIQCADMVAGSIMRWQQWGDQQFHKIVAQKVSIWKYPSNENPPS